MSSGIKTKYPKSQSKGSSMSSSLFSTDYEEDDEQCSNEECPAKVSFKTDYPSCPQPSKSSKPKSTNTIPKKNQAGQTPSTADKGGQKEEPECDYPCESACPVGCYDALYCNIPWHKGIPQTEGKDVEGEESVVSGLENSDNTSDISCHCFDNEEDEDDEDDEEDNKNNEDSNKDKDDEDNNNDQDGEQSQNEEEDPNDENQSNDESENEDQGQSQDEVYYDNSPFGVTAKFLDLSGQVIFPCPTGWRVPVMPQCGPCSGIPGNLLFPPICLGKAIKSPNTCKNCKCKGGAGNSQDSDKNGNDQKEQGDQGAKNNKRPNKKGGSANKNGKGGKEDNGAGSTCTCSSKKTQNDQQKRPESAGKKDQKGKPSSPSKSPTRPGSREKSPNGDKKPDQGRSRKDQNQDKTKDDSKGKSKKGGSPSISPDRSSNRSSSSRSKSPEKDTKKKRENSPSKYPKGTTVVPCTQKCKECRASSPTGSTKGNRTKSR